MLEFKHITLNESTLNFLVGPRNEQLVVVIGLRQLAGSSELWQHLLSQPCRKVYGYFQIVAFPVSFKENAKLLRRC